MEQNLTAIVIGATGLVGRHLIQELVNDQRFDKIKVFSRRSPEIESPQIEEHLIDFDRLEDYKSHIQGDVLFSCMGTTIKTAGSKEVQYKVDYTYQFRMAQFASENGVPDYVLVSSTGANPDSGVFYSRMKGELERDVKELGFQRCILIRPSVLMGERPEFRLGEVIGGKVINTLAAVLPFLKKYKGILGQDVAKSMLEIYHVEQDHGTQIFALDQLRKYLKN